MIVFSGMVGVGKTTWAKAVSQVLRTNHWQEDLSDGHLLESYYKDPARWGFASQLSFLLSKYRVYKHAQHRDIVERSIEEDLLFMRVNYRMGRVNDSEFRIYNDVYAELEQASRLKTGRMRRPSLYVCLTAGLRTILERMQGRGRAGESEGELLYWKTLYCEYERWFDELSSKEHDVLFWDTEHHDAFEHQHVVRLAYVIDEVLKSRHYN